MKLPRQAPNRVLIVGAGFMGRGIAQICAQRRLSVTVVDIDVEALAEARKHMQWSLEKLFAKHQITEEPETILERVVFSKGQPRSDKVDYLIECVPEKIAVKEVVFRKWDKICPPETIFASNTSAIPIGKIAALTGRPDRCIGTHFASPPVMQKLVEMIPSLLTSPDTKRITREFLKTLDRIVIEVHVDTAGFVMNRIYLIAAAEAIRLLERGVGSAEEIDKAMRVGYGWAKGPLEAADFAGLDIIHGAMSSIWEGTGNTMYCPPESLIRLVEAGQLGRKTGTGFYDYKT